MKVSKIKSSIFVIPFFVRFIAFWAVPFVYGIYMSFNKMSLTKGNKGFVGLENYITILGGDSRYSEAFILGLKNTLMFVVVSVPLLINALNGIDPALYEASAIDGANFVNQFKSIIVPNIKSVFAFVALTTIIASFNLYGQPHLITKGGPTQSTKSLIMGINGNM